MRVLYIATDNPAIETLLGGMHDEQLWGLPACYYPLKMLLERGHTVDLLLISNHDYHVVETEHFKRNNLIQVSMKSNGKTGVIEFPLLMAKATRRCLKERKYDFVYGMSEASQAGVFVAARKGIPCALRQFGTQEMANILESVPKMTSRRLKALKDYTYITISLLSKKTFLLATNDGSRADELYQILGFKKKPYQFFFWRSGVSIPKTIEHPEVKETGNYPKTYDPLVISMIGRITDVKRQDRAVRILGELHKRGIKAKLFFIGDINDEIRAGKMYQDLMRVAENYNVKDYLCFPGACPHSFCREYARNSFVTLLVGEWNRVNIFYEVMGEGAVVVTNDNHSIDEFIQDGVNCLVYEEDNFAQAAEKIIALMDEPERMTAIRNAAHQTAIEKFMSLEKRFGMEAQLVEDAAMGRDLSQYPKKL